MSAIPNPPDGGPPALANIEIDRRAVLKGLAAAGALAIPGETKIGNTPDQS
jgi:hypothetical protein